MFGLSLRWIGAAVIVLAVAGAYARGHAVAKARFDVRAALTAAEVALAQERRNVAALDTALRAERARATSAHLGMEESARLAERALERAADLEDLFDEIYGTEGGDVPAPDILLRAIGVLGTQ